MKETLKMNWKQNKINVAIQVLPQQDGSLSYELVDKAIEAIKATGYRYQVCPFETVVECKYSELADLIGTIHEATSSAGAGSMLTNMKIQIDFNKNVIIEDKMEKYS